MPETPREWRDRFAACFQHHRPEFSARDAQQIAADVCRVGFELEPEQVAMFVAAQPTATLRDRPPRSSMTTLASSKMVGWLLLFPWGLLTGTAAAA